MSTTRRILVVGDVHATKSDLEDCQKLMDFVYGLGAEYCPDGFVFLGDLLNDHDTVSVKVLDWWRQALHGISMPVTLVVGNHDQEFAGSSRHALFALKTRGISVVDGPCMLAPGVGALPYYGSPEDFLAALGSFTDPVKTLICHQTFVGARFDNSYPAKDGVDPGLVAVPRIISGHIHRPQTVGQVVYFGAPRWRTLDDANVDRYVYLVDFDGDGAVTRMQRFPTGPVCRRIWRFDDLPGDPFDAVAHPEVDPSKDVANVYVYGSPTRVRAREAELRAAGFRTRGFPDRARRVAVRESEGVGQAFIKFVDAFRPTRGTHLDLLKSFCNERIAA